MRLRRTSIAALKMIVCAILVALMVALMIPASAWAQRGMGEKEGVAQQPVKPEMVELAGTVDSIDTHACAQTTGHGYWGMHMMLRSADDRTLNVHLGPVSAVKEMVAGLEEGTRVQVKAFRTERMPADHYVAQSVSWDDQQVTLRDATSLRPVWAGQLGAGQQGMGRQRGMGGQRGMGRMGPGPMRGNMGMAMPGADGESMQDALQRLQQKVQAMNEATGQAKVDAMAEVVSELVDQHTAMMKMRMQRRERMMQQRPRGMGPGQGRGPATQPGSGMQGQ